MITPNQHRNDLILLSQTLALDDLREMPRKELKELFSVLEAPSIDEMNGEYRSELMDQGGRLADILVRFFFNVSGKWLGKAFQPTNEHEGHGYNSFQTRRGVQRTKRMQTTISPSGFHDGDSYTIRYDGLHRGFLGKLVGEVRRVRPGLYLGFGGMPIRNNIYFTLSGPVSEFQREP